MCRCTEIRMCHLNINSLLQMRVPSVYCLCFAFKWQCYRFGVFCLFGFLRKQYVYTTKHATALTIQTKDDDSNNRVQCDQIAHCSRGIIICWMCFFAAAAALLMVWHVHQINVKPNVHEKPHITRIAEAFLASVFVYFFCRHCWSAQKFCVGQTHSSTISIPNDKNSYK